MTANAYDQIPGPTKGDSGLLPESPALASRSSVANAYELKCVVSESMARELASVLGQSMQLDPFVLKSVDQRYRITTLSTDTVDLSCFHRVAGYARRKFRVRRYGDESILYLERKARRGHRVDKTRSVIAIAELPQLAETSGTPDSGSSGDSEKTHSTDWTGASFRSQIARRLLLPNCLMTYERQAWFGASENGPVRFTLDRNLKGQRTTEWSMMASGSAPPTEIITDNEVICEFKFRGALPLLFKKVIQDFSLSPGGFSKYRNCMSRLMTTCVEPANGSSVREFRDA